MRPAISYSLVLLLLSTTSAFAQEVAQKAPQGVAGNGLSRSGASDVAPGLSSALGAIHAQATRCGMGLEAQEAAAGQRRHVERVGHGLNADPTPLDLAFRESAAAQPAAACAPEVRAQISRGLSDLLSYVDAFHDSLALVE